MNTSQRSAVGEPTAECSVHQCPIPQESTIEAENIGWTDDTSTDTDDEVCNFIIISTIKSNTPNDVFYISVFLYN